MLKASYFESERLDVWILILHELEEDINSATLRSIKFFPSEEELLNFIKKKDIPRHSSQKGSVIKQIIHVIGDYLLGKKIDLFKAIDQMDVNFSLEGKTEFFKRVLQSLLDVKYGETTTYSALGDILDSKAYRAIGNACKSNPLPLIFPCHRVLRKDGTLGGFMGKADKSWQLNLKRTLLKLEGILE